MFFWDLLMRERDRMCNCVSLCEHAREREKLVCVVFMHERVRVCVYLCVWGCVCVCACVKREKSEKYFSKRRQHFNWKPEWNNRHKLSQKKWRKKFRPREIQNFEKNFAIFWKKEFLVGGGKLTRILNGWCKSVVLPEKIRICKLFLICFTFNLWS